MKIFYVLRPLAIIGALSLLLIGCKTMYSAKTRRSESSAQDSSKSAKKDPKDSLYRDLRQLAFSATPEQMGVRIPAVQTKVYGVIMDWGLPEGTATLVTFLSGDASMYLSSGGGIVGGVGHENVKRAAIEFINKAGSYLSQAVRTDSTPLPRKGEVKFYFLTNEGKFVGQEQVLNFENNSSKWLDLFEEGNTVITELRATVDRK